MVYRINGRRVTKEEFFERKGTPIKAGDTVAVYGAQAFEAFSSPIDGSVISNKQAIKDHEKKHGVIHTGDTQINKGCHGNTRQQDIIHQQQKGNEND